MAISRDQAPRKRLLLTVAIAAIVVAIAAVIFSVYLATRTPDATAVPAPTSDSTTPAPTGAGIDACLGGEELTANAIFTAQRDATPTPEGAVSFAAAFARYALQIPAPTDAAELASWTGLSAEWWSRWEASAQSWSGPQPLGVTTVNGGYRIDAYSPDEAVVTLELPWVVDGAISPTRTFVPTVTMQRTVAGTWSITNVDNSGDTAGGTLSDRTDFVDGC